MTAKKNNIHFVHNSLINPTNPVTVSVIGAGGTGSQVVTALARISESLRHLHHPGLQLKLIDDDLVTAANMGRQLFSASEIGLPKSVALIHRLNRFFGTNWKAVTEKITIDTPPENCFGQITISCVDTTSARFDIENILTKYTNVGDYCLQPLYWMDFGNSRFTGQVILSTVGKLLQPPSKRFKTIGHLPFVTDEFKYLLRSRIEDNEPSCSLAEALNKQDLFINSTLANMGCSLLWNMFREGMIEHRGFFLNLKTLQSQPIHL